MSKKSVFIFLTVVGVAALAAGLGVLIWWLVTSNSSTSTIILENGRVGDIDQTAGFTRVSGAGDNFWWFYPTLAASPTSRPLLVWLDGVTGLSPSLLANFGMFGPYDLNLDRRNDSWVEDYNLLFIDAPLGTGFSTVAQNGRVSENLEEISEHLTLVLESLFSVHPEFQEAPLYLMGQGHGAQLALSLAIKLHETGNPGVNLQGVTIGNGIISPAAVLKQLGFYLKQLSYVEERGLSAVESFSSDINDLVDNGNLAGAFDLFISLEDHINEAAGAVAVNLGAITDKLTRDSLDYYGQLKYLQKMSRIDVNPTEFMTSTVAPALGISGSYDAGRAAATEALRSVFMTPAIEKVEYLLNNTNVKVAIYNGNLDAVSNTPGQLQWVNNLQWSGQQQFVNTPRSTLVINGVIEGYFRETERLSFYWINAAGQSDIFSVVSRQGTTRPTKGLVVPSLRQVVPLSTPVINNAILVEKGPLDSPQAMRRVLQLIFD